MKTSIWFTTSILLTGIFFSPFTSAQKMYRCGSIYQDRQCEGAQAGKVIGSTGSQQSAPISAVDAECAQRGADALKISWAREAGALADRQMADIDSKKLPASKSTEDKKLVADVYRRRGSAPEIRTAIEVDCMAEKERDKAIQAAAIAAAAAKPTGPTQPATSTKNPSTAPGSSQTQAKP